MSKVRVEIDERWLECDLTEEELLTYGHENANQIRQRSNLEAEKRAYNSRIKSEIDASTEQIEKLSDKISTRKEYREVECKVIEDYNDFTLKVVRLDTHEAILDRPMTKSEKSKIDDLFFEDEEAEPEESEDDEEEQEQVTEACPYGAGGESDA